jgi:hypothetical protein
MMIGGDDDYSPFDRLWELIGDRFAFISPLWVIRRPETLTIVDYRPTFTMFLTAAGIVVLAVSFVFLFFRMDIAIVSGLWTLSIPGLFCVIFLFKGTIRETYSFDKTTDSYAFARQFIHRREVIEGAMSQFTGAYVKTVRNDDSEAYYVVLKQDGMFLTGADEQTLREEVPIFNSYNRESRIADAISGFISSSRAAPGVAAE